MRTPHKTIKGPPLIDMQLASTGKVINGGHSDPDHFHKEINGGTSLLTSLAVFLGFGSWLICGAKLSKSEPHLG